MKYRVVLSRLACMDLDEAHQRAHSHAPQAADAWLSRFRNALATLGQLPERCPFAHENRRAAIELREFHFGNRPNVFRVIFTIEGESVRILRIRRAQRRVLTRGEISSAQGEGD